MSANRSHLHHATVEEVRNAFVVYRDDLEWLAFFLTGQEEMAKACIVDACALAVTGNQVFEEWLEHWARRATINSAIEMQKARIVELGPVYERQACFHSDHSSMSQDSARLLRYVGESLIPSTDVLCRFALVLRGIENYAPREAALLLGVSSQAIESAYCIALNRFATLNHEIEQKFLVDTNSPTESC